MEDQQKAGAVIGAVTDDAVCGKDAQTVKFESFSDAYNHVNDQLLAIKDKANLYARNFMELTGYHPDSSVKAADVVAIIAKLKAGN